MTIDANDNAAMMAGFTRPVLIEGNLNSFAALVRPDDYLDEVFTCFDTDNQEWLTVRGWLVENVEDLECAA